MARAALDEQPVEWHEIPAERGRSADLACEPQPGHRPRIVSASIRQVKASRTAFGPEPRLPRESFCGEPDLVVEAQAEIPPANGTLTFDHDIEVVREMGEVESRQSPERTTIHSNYVAHTQAPALRNLEEPYVSDSVDNSSDLRLLVSRYELMDLTAKDDAAIEILEPHIAGF